MDELRTHLDTAVRPERLARLGFRPDDAEAVGAVWPGVRTDDAAMARVAVLVRRLAAGVGGAEPATFDAEDDQHPAGRGILPLLALLATVDDVHAWHRARGIDADTSWRSLADLGQQVWVNRLTHGEFGLHTHRWLTTAWAGTLLWLGRLQFELKRLTVEPYPGALVLSVHIPQSGPLTPAAVDSALEAAEVAYARHFPDQRPAWFHCASWLLEPRLAAGLPGSNIAAFQQRWDLFGTPEPGTADAVFFTFRRRGPVRAHDLPTGSRLEALVAEHVRRGEDLHVRHGRIPFRGALARTGE